MHSSYGIPRTQNLAAIFSCPFPKSRSVERERAENACSARFDLRDQLASHLCPGSPEMLLALEIFDGPAGTCEADIRALARENARLIAEAKGVQP